MNRIIPKHLAIIMDGNGRWAKKKRLNRLDGHKAGVRVVKELVKYCVKLNIKHLTLYTFSIENWKRPQKEIIGLIKLLLKTLDEELKLLLENNVKFKVLGNLKRMDLITIHKLKKVEKKTQENTGLHLNLAISYSGREEIISAINTIINKNKKMKINQKLFEKYLFTYKTPDPDLLIRTGGEIRLSNFLLWQMAYSELFFTKILWPDFNNKILDNAIDDFNKRQRRFGKTSEQINE